MLSNSQIDKIGDQLREGRIDAECIRKLEVFRSLFGDAYAFVENTFKDKLKLNITGRPSKSTVAIIEKLKRESIRLSQIQDIAGCRVLTTNLASQDHLIQVARVFLGDVEIDDKRLAPTNGYRAVHLIVKRGGRLVEVQVRTRLQHVWAEFSEKVSDAFGQAIKYGSGEEWAVSFLLDLSTVTAKLEGIQHEKDMISTMKTKRGISHDMVRRHKTLNQGERDCFRQIKLLFERIPRIATEP